MRLASDVQQDAYRAAGLQPLPRAQALELMGRALAGDATTPVFAKIDWARLKPLHEAKGAAALPVGYGSPGNRGVAAGSAHEICRVLREARADQREQLLLDFVQAEVAAVLKNAAG